MPILSIKSVKISLIIIFSCFLVYLISLNPSKKQLVYVKYSPKIEPDGKVKAKFDDIYKKRYWSNDGDGSGGGSTISQTLSARKILIEVITEYSIRSMLDAPCGSFLWMSIVMKNVTAEFRSRGEQFRYHGVDVVTDLINIVREKYANLSEDLEFSVCDFSRQDLPQNYDLIFSRDALMHLSYEKILSSLRSFSQVNGARYLLVGSYQTNYSKNVNIGIGNHFNIDLRKPPFNLTEYVRVYDEISNSPKPKSLILYDIPNYLRKIDFDDMKKRLKL